MTLRRVVVTGMGTVSPLGAGVQHSWDRLIAAQSGVRSIQKLDTSVHKTHFAAQVPRKSEGFDQPWAFDEDTVLSEKERRRWDDVILLGMAAADEAFADSGLVIDSEEMSHRCGVIIGSGQGGVGKMDYYSTAFAARGPKIAPALAVPSILINLIAGRVSIKHSLKGPNSAVVTACATGTHAIGDGWRIIAMGDADVMLAGGSESVVTHLGLAGFGAARALSTRNDDPEAASRPWDKDRDGFVLGEGAGVVVLEALDHAQARGAKIYGEVVGYGMSGDAHHIVAPDPDGHGGYRAVEAALKRADLPPSAVDYINAHATSTPLGDGIELAAMQRLFGQDLGGASMSGTKSAIGHCLGAAGAIEAIMTLKALQCQIAPPTLNLHRPEDAAADVDLVPLVARPRRIHVAVSNSFGFGGTNASLVFKAL